MWAAVAEAAVMSRSGSMVGPRAENRAASVERWASEKLVTTRYGMARRSSVASASHRAVDRLALEDEDAIGVEHEAGEVAHGGAQVGGVGQSASADGRLPPAASGGDAC